MLTHITELPLPLIVLAAVLVVGATLRLTRFITTDKLGAWLAAPALRWSNNAEQVKRNAMATVVANANNSVGGLTDDAIIVTSRWQDELRSNAPLSWQARLVAGLGCPFCVGFWVGLFVIVVTIAALAFPIVGEVWMILAAALTLNYCTGHLAAKID